MTLINYLIRFFHFVCEWDRRQAAELIEHQSNEPPAPTGWG